MPTVAELKEQLTAYPNDVVESVIAKLRKNGEVEGTRSKLKKAELELVLSKVKGVDKRGKEEYKPPPAPRREPREEYESDDEDEGAAYIHFLDSGEEYLIMEEELEAIGYTIERLLQLRGTNLRFWDVVRSKGVRIDTRRRGYAPKFCIRALITVEG